MSRIALLRPGAVGDIIMTLNLLPLLRQKYPGHEFHYYCHPDYAEGLRFLFEAAGVSSVLDCRALTCEYEQVINLVGYPLHEGYPEEPMRQHLLHYFAQEMGLTLSENPRLRLDKPPRPQSPITAALLSGTLPPKFATVHVQAGWSHYKNWSFDRWERVLAECSHVPVYQIGLASDYKLRGADHRFMGCHLSVSVALMAHAVMHLGVDSFTNHLTHYEWHGKGQTPAIILWGSTQASAAGYTHNINISLSLPCQPCFREDPQKSRMPRGPCTTPPGQTYEKPRHACMDGIKVEMVVREVRSLWEKVS